MNIKSFFKSRTRQRIEKAIAVQLALAAECEVEKIKNRADTKRYCQLWTIQKDHERNILLLKSLL